MSALDPVASARPAYLPTGPREEYRGERPVYRRDVGPRGGATPAGVQASIPSRPATTAVAADQVSAERHEPAATLSAEPSTSQEAIAVQPITPTSTNPATHLPQAGPSVSTGEPPQDIGEAYNGGGEPGVVDFNPAQLAVFTEGSQKDRILAAVAHGAHTTTERIR